jgi:hypothetical protein
MKKESKTTQGAHLNLSKLNVKIETIVERLARIAPNETIKAKKYG